MESAPAAAAAAAPVADASPPAAASPRSSALDAAAAAAAATQGELTAGQRVLVNVCCEFDSVDHAELKTVDVIRAAEAMMDLYDLMFPSGGQVPALLKKDHRTHIEQVRTAFQLDATNKARVADFVHGELRARGRDAVRKDWGVGVLGLLWIGRTVAFITRFLALLEQTDVQPYKAARDAYGEVLRPYHTMVVSVVVRIALGLVGDRAKLRDNFGLQTDELTVVWLTTTATSMRRVVDALMKVLRDADCDFTDAVGIM